MEIGLVPDALVVAGSGVKDAAFSLRAGPGPGFGFCDVVVALGLADHEDVAVGAVLGVDVCFVPGVKGLETFQGRMVWLDDGGGKLLAFVVFELRADEFDEAGFVSETEAGRVDGDEAATFLDEFDEVLILVRLDVVVVGVKKDAIELI